MQPYIYNTEINEFPLKRRINKLSGFQCKNRPTGSYLSNLTFLNNSKPVSPRLTERLSAKLVGHQLRSMPSSAREGHRDTKSKYMVDSEKRRYMLESGQFVNTPF